MAKPIALSHPLIILRPMNEEAPKRKRRAVTQIRLLPKVKDAAQQAADEDGRSLSGYIEMLLMEQLKKRGFLK